MAPIFSQIIKYRHKSQFVSLGFNKVPHPLSLTLNKYKEKKSNSTK